MKTIKLMYEDYSTGITSAIIDETTDKVKLIEWRNILLLGMKNLDNEMKNIKYNSNNIDPNNINYKKIFSYKKLRKIKGILYSEIDLRLTVLKAENRKQNLIIEAQIKEELYKLYINNESDEIILIRIKELKNK